MAVAVVDEDVIDDQMAFLLPVGRSDDVICQGGGIGGDALGEWRDELAAARHRGCNPVFRAWSEAGYGVDAVGSGVVAVEDIAVGVRCRHAGAGHAVDFTLRLGGQEVFGENRAGDGRLDDVGDGETQPLLVYDLAVERQAFDKELDDVAVADVVVHPHGNGPLARRGRLGQYRGPGDGVARRVVRVRRIGYDLRVAGNNGDGRLKGADGLVEGRVVDCEPHLAKFSGLPAAIEVVGILGGDLVFIEGFGVEVVRCRGAERIEENVRRYIERYDDVGGADIPAI